VATTLGLHAPRLDAVRELLTKRGRREAGRFIVEGPTMLEEARGAGAEPEALYATKAGATLHARLVSAFDDRLYVVPDRAMARLSDVETSPGILGVFPTRLHPLDALLSAGKAAAVLAGVADPGNAGTLLRTAEIFGIERAIFVGDGVEPYNPKVVRATMGAIFRLGIAVCEPSELANAAAAAGYRIVATGRAGVPLPDFRFPAKPLIAIGNERHGVAHVLPQYDDEVAIPHLGRGESLNASIAGGIIFYAFSQQA
jgi:TrmH family RNA methyltransferase